jgi:hypothetical protein
VWITVTLLTPPEPETVLLNFYRKVRPDVRGWRAIARRIPDVRATRDLGANTLDWLLGCAMVYLILFGTGKLILQQAASGVGLLVAACAVSTILYRRLMSRNWSEPAQADGAAANTGGEPLLARRAPNPEMF